MVCGVTLARDVGHEAVGVNDRWATSENATDRVSLRRVINGAKMPRDGTPQPISQRVGVSMVGVGKERGVQAGAAARLGQPVE